MVQVAKKYIQKPVKSSIVKSSFYQEADIDGDQHVSFEEFSNIFNEG